MWCWKRLLRVPWTSRRLNQSILKEINPEYSLEWLMLKLKLHYFGHLMPRAIPLEKTLMLGKIEGRRRRGWQRMGWLDGITDSMDMSLSKLREIVRQGSLACCSPWICTEVAVTEQLKSSNRQEHWNGLPCLPPGNFLTQGSTHNHCLSLRLSYFKLLTHNNSITVTEMKMKLGNIQIPCQQFLCFYLILNFSQSMLNWIYNFIYFDYEINTILYSVSVHVSKHFLYSNTDF